MNTEGQTRASLVPNATDRVYHIRVPDLSSKFRFEWHPVSRRVYLIRLGTMPLVGDPIALNISTYGDAFNATLVWCRGYREGACITIGVAS